jgi:hypothetical protein
VNQRILSGTTTCSAVHWDAPLFYVVINGPLIPGYVVALVLFPCLGCIRMDLRRAIKLLLTSKSCSRPINQLLAPSLCRWLCKAPEPPHQVEVPFSFSCALCSLCVFVQPAPSANRGSALKSLVAQPRLIKCLRGRFAIAPPSRHPRHDH